MGISTNHGASQKIFGQQLKLDYPLLSAFAAPEVVRDYTGWLDEGKRLANRAYIVIDKQGIVRFKKVGEMVPIQELEQVLTGLE